MLKSLDPICFNILGLLWTTHYLSYQAPIKLTSVWHPIHLSRAKFIYEIIFSRTVFKNCLAKSFHNCFRLDCFFNAISTLQKFSRSHRLWCWSWSYWNNFAIYYWRGIYKKRKVWKKYLILIKINLTSNWYQESDVNNYLIKKTSW